MIILGIAGGFNFGTGDTAAALLVDGALKGACEEERFTRVKFAPHRVPVSTMRWLLNEQGITLGDVDVLACNIAHSASFDENLRRFLQIEFGVLPRRIEYYNHHLCHAACAFWSSGLPEAAILTYDYSGDGLCTGLYEGRNGDIVQLETRQTRTGQSLGKLYAAFTQYLGFGRGDEYKLMGLSAYGNRGDLLDLSGVIWTGRDDYRIDSRIFHDQPLTSVQQHVFNEDYLARLGLSGRLPDAPVVDEHKRLAISIQCAFEQATLAMARRLKETTSAKTIVLSGGCALNCVAMSELRRSGLFEEVLVPPAPSDAGTALGAAYLAAHSRGGVPEPVHEAGLGPEYSPEEIAHWLDVLRIKASRIDEVAASAAADIAGGQLVGWYQGRSEFGPRALGHRSILADPANPTTRDKLNSRVKFRESFRPFAPSVCEENAHEFFADAAPCPFMTMIFDVKEPDRIPAVTHVDGTARVQTVNAATGDRLYYGLLREMETLTGIPMVLNTSFNINGQPIVNSPHEAIYTFFSSGLDVLYVGPYRVTKH